jgi:putative restriction endonuclease
MAKAVFTTRVRPDYDDIPEYRYHFPATYLNQARAAVGDWIVYYEPRRHDADPGGREGRQAYFATARVTRVVEDPRIPRHYYANVADYLEFDQAVPFRFGTGTLEGALTKADGSTNKGAFGRSVRLLKDQEYQLIVHLGFADIPDDPVDEPLIAEIDRPLVETLVSRPFRDAAFARQVREAYDATCAFTGLKLINGGGRCEIEAAHIRPVGDRHHGPDSPRNGLALSRTFHWLFDRGLISLDDDLTILTADRLVPDTVKRLINPEGRLLGPRFPALRPHPVFLKYHRDQIFKG